MNSGRRVLIVGAAPVPGAQEHYARVITAATHVIAADAGLVLCRAVGRLPDVCVGDFDSTPPDVLAEAEAAGARILSYPAEKDESDLDLALAAAREMGAREVRFTAAFAGRLDHTLAALGTVAAAADLGAVCEEPDFTAHVLSAVRRGRLRLTESPGTVISVLATGGNARLTTEGFAYSLDAAEVEPLSSLGLSNVAVEAVQTIEVLAGAVLVLVNHPGDK